MSWKNLDPTRIFATSGALGLNIVILMLLLVPAARMVMPQIAEKTTITWTMPTPKELPPPAPPPKDPVKITKATPITPTPTVKPVAIDPQPTELVMPMGNLPAISDPAPVESAPTDTGASAGPIVGVHLEYQSAPPPKYPREDLIARHEGTVLLQVLVGVDGRPIEVTIQHGSGWRSLDEAARRFVLRNWTFRPATKDGQPVQAVGIVPIDFKLG